MGLGEREYLISPEFGHAVMTSCEHVVTSETRAKSTKQYEWMSDEQFANLKVIDEFINL